MQKYLIRFDDICHDMDWEKWNIIEANIIRLNIKPILGVIPDNKDKKIMSRKNTEVDFWKQVRYWQSLDWTIALHGYQHAFETKESGLIKLNKRSEFAGLPYEIQEYKINKALQIFKDNGVTTRMWMAPAHSFDKTTISILKKNNIDMISDGLYHRPVKLLGMLWIPQQLWSFKKIIIPNSLWTVCYHINTYSDYQLEIIVNDLEKNRKDIISINEIENYFNTNPKNWIDEAFNFIFLKKMWIFEKLYKYFRFIK